jgi:hypothetical protein
LLAVSSSDSPDHIDTDHNGSTNMGDGFSETWYEVVEIQPNGERLRVGLYQDEGEALLGLQTREMIRDRRLENKSPDLPRSTFSLQLISKREAMGWDESV